MMSKGRSNVFDFVDSVDMASRSLGRATNKRATFAFDGCRTNRLNMNIRVV